MAAAAPDANEIRREHAATAALGLAAALIVAATGAAHGWTVDHPGIVAFLACAAVFAAMQGISLGPKLVYDAADPIVILAGMIGGPLGGAVAGCATAGISAHGFRSRIGYASIRAAQGATAGAAVHVFGLSAGTAGDALAAAAAAEVAGTAVVFGATIALSLTGIFQLTRSAVLANLSDPALGVPLVAGLALAYDGSGAGAIVLLLVPALIAATAVRLVRMRWTERHAESEARARRDPLTGAYNRRWFEEAIDEEVRAGTNVGLVLLDLDHFKRVNDRYGHAAGDAVLVETVRRLSARVRTGDGVVRWGGEELAVLLVGVGDGTDLAARAEELRSAIGDDAFVVDGRAIAVTASAGAATLEADADSLVRAADAALYDAKRAGRNRAVLV
ncbi:MAG TPA: GGDEF domain-containing protein [Gaiellaceae bacterium]|jgi:diguanylate cyclase (GGDEF)-like protein